MSLYTPDIRSEKPEVRSGHTCFEFRGKIYVWGGFHDDKEETEEFIGNEYISSDSLWIYNINTCTWQHVSCSGEKPEDLSGACASQVGQTLYVFGGHAHDFGHTCHVHSLNLLTYKWKDHSSSLKGQLPLPRDKFGAWVFEDRIIYFGGYGPAPSNNNHGPFVHHEYARGWNGQIVVLNLNKEALEWDYPLVKGDPPQPRAAHGMTRIGNHGYLFGGRHSVCRDNDLHCLDLENFTWSGRLKIDGPEPCGRSWHVFITCGPKHILLHGGFDEFSRVLEDAWLLDVHNLSWIEIDAFKKMSPPRTRLWHAACQTENEGEIAIFGGCSSSLFQRQPDYTNDLMFFMFTPRNLQRLCEEEIVKSKAQQALNLHALPKQISRNLKARFRSARESQYT